MDGRINLSVDASVTNREGKTFSLSAAVGVERGEDGTGALYVRVGEVVVFKEPLSGLVNEDSVLAKIPAHVFAVGDPITGCLIRAGISTGVAQIIDCKNKTEDIDWWRARAEAIGQCIRRNIPNILLKVGFRATWCIVKAGF